MIAALPMTASSVAVATATTPTQAQSQESSHSGEDFLMEMLAAMDSHMQQLRETQQGLVATVELACRRALDRNFGRLMLVGSAALRVETPGSDVDVVCFTRRDGAETVGLPVDVLRRVHWALKELIDQYSGYAASFSMELIDDARVPILRVLWGPSDHPVAVDVSVDQSRPVDHVRWFQRVGAAPRPTAPQPAVAPLVTLTLRCVKWWLKQRQIPRTKEGGLPTLAWLLMAVHVCSLPDTHEQALLSGQRPMAALLASLTAFFRHYASLDRLDGVLQFAADGSSSEFRRRSLESRKPGAEPWAELAVLDPTREGHESLNLAPRLPPATQLLLAYELRRAGQRLEMVPRSGETSAGQSRRILEDVFQPIGEGTNSLPPFSAGGVGALFLSGGSSSTSRTVELGVIEYVDARPGWTAPFLHRSDERSELHVKLCDVEGSSSNRCISRRGKSVVLSPCQFICRVRLDKEGKNNWRIDQEGLERYRSLKRYMTDLTGRSQPEVKEPPAKVATPPVESPHLSQPPQGKASEDSGAVEVAGTSAVPGCAQQALSSIPSPTRSRVIPI